MTSVALRTYKGRLGPSTYPPNVFSKLEVDLAFLTQLLVYSRASSPAAVSKEVGVVYIPVGFAHA